MQTLIKEEVNTSIFESKEHYLAFRKAWSESVNSPEAKKTLIRPEYGDPYRKPGCMNSGHFVLYAILRGRDWRKGFTIPTRENKKNNRADLVARNIVRGYWDSNDWYIERGQGKSQAAPTPDHLVKLMETFLSPFKGTVTIEMLLEVGEKLGPTVGLD